MKLKKLNKIKLHTMTLVYGLPGTGKTSYINTLPGKTLIIDADRGLASVDSDTFNGDVAECDTYNDVLEALELGKDYDSIAIDHMSKVQELCYKEILQENNAKKMLINHYGEASTKLKSLIDTLVDYAYEGKNILVIAQEKTINIEDEIDENIPSQIIPNLMESVRSYLVASSRIVGHMEKVTKSKIVKGKKESKEVFQLRIAGNPIFNLKVTRKPNLEIPDVIPNPKWDIVVGLTDGTTQEKIAKKKQAQAEKGE